MTGPGTGVVARRERMVANRPHLASPGARLRLIERFSDGTRSHSVSGAATGETRPSPSRPGVAAPVEHWRAAGCGGSVAGSVHRQVETAGDGVSEPGRLRSAAVPGGGDAGSNRRCETGGGSTADHGMPGSAVVVGPCSDHRVGPNRIGSPSGRGVRIGGPSMWLIGHTPVGGGDGPTARELSPARNAAIEPVIVGRWWRRSPDRLIRRRRWGPPKAPRAMRAGDAMPSGVGCRRPGSGPVRWWRRRRLRWGPIEVSGGRRRRRRGAAGGGGRLLAPVPSPQQTMA